jgi:TrmH family RNA methyltransferase
MLSGNQVKYINALKLKKNRETQRQFIAEGSKLVIELLNGPYHINEIYATPEWIGMNAAFVRPGKIIPQQVTEKELSRITALNTPSPVLAIVSIPSAEVEPLSFNNKLVLALDDIRDPGNLGTIIRIADWYGISAVICSETTVDLYNPKVVQATMGSIARIPVHYTNLADFLSGLPASHKVYGSFLEGENIYTSVLSDNGVIIIGNESKGISQGVEKFVTDKIHIPSFATGKKSEEHVESLNASVAAAVICSEFRRRKF